MFWGIGVSGVGFCFLHLIRCISSVASHPLLLHSTLEQLGGDTGSKRDGEAGAEQAGVEQAGVEQVARREDGQVAGGAWMRGSLDLHLYAPLFICVDTSPHLRCAALGAWAAVARARRCTDKTLYRQDDF